MTRQLSAAAVEDSFAVGEASDLYYLGPAFVGNFEDFQQDGASSIAPLVPTLLGAIAEGIVLTQIDQTAAQLSIDFNCEDPSGGFHPVDIVVPMRDHSPL